MPRVLINNGGKKEFDVFEKVRPRLEYIREYLSQYSEWFEVVDTVGYWLPADTGYKIVSDEGDNSKGTLRFKIILKAKKYCNVRIRASYSSGGTFEITDKYGVNVYKETLYERAKVDKSIRTDIDEHEMFATLAITMLGMARVAMGLVWAANEEKEYTKELILLKDMMLNWVKYENAE